MACQHRADQITILPCVGTIAIKCSGCGEAFVRASLLDEANRRALPDPEEAKLRDAVVEAADRWEKYSTQRSEEECGNSDGNILRRAVLALRAQKAHLEAREKKGEVKNDGEI